MTIQESPSAPLSRRFPLGVLAPDLDVETRSRRQFDVPSAEYAGGDAAGELFGFDQHTRRPVRAGSCTTHTPARVTPRRSATILAVAVVLSAALLLAGLFAVWGVDTPIVPWGLGQPNAADAGVSG